MKHNNLNKKKLFIFHGNRIKTLKIFVQVCIFVLLVFIHLSRDKFGQQNISAIENIVENVYSKYVRSGKYLIEYGLYFYNEMSVVQVGLWPVGLVKLF